MNDHKKEISEFLFKLHQEYLETLVRVLDLEEFLAGSNAGGVLDKMRSCESLWDLPYNERGTFVVGADSIMHILGGER